MGFGRLVAALVAALVTLLAAPLGAVDVEPDEAGRASILLLQARARINVDDHAYARHLLQQAARLQPDNADIHNLLGFTSRKLGRYSEAHQHYARALGLHPGHLGALEYWGELHLVEDDVAAADRLLDRLIALCPRGCEERDELAAAMAAHAERRRTGGLERPHRTYLSR